MHNVYQLCEGEVFDVHLLITCIKVASALVLVNLLLAWNLMIDQIKMLVISLELVVERSRVSTSLPFASGILVVINAVAEKITTVPLQWPMIFLHAHPELYDRSLKKRPLLFCHFY